MPVRIYDIAKPWHREQRVLLKAKELGIAAAASVQFAGQNHREYLVQLGG
jgi:hypothetical protein